MAKYYFTFGLDDGGGWAEVTADNYYMASEIFKLYHPPAEEGGFIPCGGIYTETEFQQTKMFKNGNFGKQAVEHIILNHFDFKEVVVRGTDS